MFDYFKGLPRISDMRTLALWLALVFVFAVPWENAIHVAHIGRISKVLGLLTFVTWATSAVVRGRLRTPDAFQKAFFLFLIWNGLTLYWSIDSGATTSGFKTYTEIFALLLILWDLFETERAVRAGLQAYVFGAFIASGSIIVNFVTSPAAAFPAHERISALGYQVDGIALVVAIAAPAAWYLAAAPASHARPLATRILNYAYIPFGGLALAMTGTRGATLASIPTVMLVMWSLRRSGGRGRIMAMGAIAMAVVTIIAFAPRGPLDRIGTATTVAQTDEGALSGRWGIWRESRQAFLSSPIGGVGLDAHRAAVAPEIEQQIVYKKAEKEAHNTFISILVETGIVGFALFAAVLWSVFTRLRERSGWDSAYWAAQLAVIAIGGMSLSLEDSKALWIFLSLAVASAAAAEARENAFVRRPTVGERSASPPRLVT